MTTTKKSPKKSASKKAAPAKKATPQQEAPKAPAKAPKAGTVHTIRSIAAVALAHDLPRRVPLAVVKDLGLNPHTGSRQVQEVYSGKQTVEVADADRTRYAALLEKAAAALLTVEKK